MFLSKALSYQTGIAFKKSRFDKYGKRLLFDSILFVLKVHDYVFLDYEGQPFLWTLEEIERIIQSSKEENGTLVVTLAARDRELYENPNMLSKYALLSKRYRRLGFCLVAGHPSYHSIDSSIPYRKQLRLMTSYLRKHTKSLIFLGTEKLPTKYLLDLIGNYSLIPFFIRGQQTNSKKIAELKSTIPDPSNITIYTPMTTISDTLTVLKEVLDYILRRDVTKKQLSRVGIKPGEIREMINTHTLSEEINDFLISRLNDLVIYGTDLSEQIRQMTNSESSIIIGFPCIQRNFLQTIVDFRVTKMLTRRGENNIKIPIPI